MKRVGQSHGPGGGQCHGRDFTPKWLGIKEPQWGKVTNCDKVKDWLFLALELNISKSYGSISTIFVDLECT